MDIMAKIRNSFLRDNQSKMRDETMQLLTCQFTNPGGRSPNEDSVGYFNTDKYFAWIAADGLGGHISGEIASAKAVSTLNEALSDCQKMNQEFVENTFRKMNDEILALHGPLTTAVCVFSDGKKLWYANEGDSRFYFIRNHKKLYATNDHSLAFLAYMTGNIKYEEIPTHPAQNRLFHSLGNETDFWGEFYPEIELEPGDMFLLATDGFWELITDEEILRASRISNTPEEWLSAMLSVVESRLTSVSDNYSAVCVFAKEN